MKKIFGIVMTILIAASVACAAMLSSSEEKVEKATTTSSSTQSTNPTRQEKVTTKIVTTDKAKIKESAAITLIENCSAKKLGMSNEVKKRCSFMVASNGEKIKDLYYIKVIAVIKKPHKDADGETIYSFDTKGEYYISYDGTTVLTKDLKNGEYSEIDVD